jgi:HK97 family phage portal protein
MPTVIVDGDSVTTVTARGTVSGTLAGGTERPPGTLERMQVSFERLATEQTWVAAAINWFVRQSYRCPLEARQLTDRPGETEMLPASDPVSRMLAEPWRGAGPGDLPAALIGSLQVEGNALAELHSGPGESIRALPRRWLTARPKLGDPKAGDHVWTVDGWMIGGQSVPLDRVVHAAWWAPAGAIGISPLQQIAWTVRAERAAQEWMLANLLNGARPDGLVKITDELLSKDPEERRAIVGEVTERLRSQFGGPHNAGKLPVIPPGAEWEDTERTTAVEAALIEQRQLNRVEVAAIYGLPPVALGILDDASYNNIDALIPYSATSALGPVLQLVEQRLTARLRRLLGRPELVVAFNMTALLRGDFLKEIRAGREATGVATFTPQEYRDRLGLRRLDTEGIDDLWVQSKSNVAPMGRADAIDDDQDDDDDGAGAAAASRPRRT